MISQPRIAVLGLSQLYVFMCLDDWLLVVVVLGFELYLWFKLRFKPSAYLYLRTSSKTKDRYLGLLQSLLFHYSSSIIRLPRGLVSVHYYKGSQVSSNLVLVSTSVLVLKSAKWRYDLVPSRLVSSTLLSLTCSSTSRIRLSQAYGCSDRYNEHHFQNAERLKQGQK